MSSISGGSLSDDSPQRLADDQLLCWRRSSRRSRSLLTTQNQISTGKSVNVPGDAPQSVASILALNEQLATRAQTDNNLSNASSILNSVDQAMSDASNLVNQRPELGLQPDRHRFHRRDASRPGLGHRRHDPVADEYR